MKKKKKNSHVLCSDTNARMLGWFFHLTIAFKVG